MDYSFLTMNLNAFQPGQISALPPVISYTPLRLITPATTSDESTSSSTQNSPIIIPRRDLFDVRFQLLNDDDEDMDETPKELEFVAAPSDLVPGVYEGGLKTWECSIDLAAYLAHEVRPEVLGKRFLEVIINSLNACGDLTE